MSEASSPPPNEPEAPEPAGGRLRAGPLLWICATLMLIIVVRSFVIQVFVVIGDSMEPTLQDDEHLLVNRMAPRFGQIGRGDLLVCIHPDAPRKRLVKRVIALPGETVRITAGRVFIRKADEPFELPLPEVYLTDTARSASINATPYTVPEGCFFLLGDNRNNSRDSRDFGAVPGELVVGRVFCVVWPFSKAKHL